MTSYAFALPPLDPQDDHAEYPTPFAPAPVSTQQVLDIEPDTRPVTLRMPHAVIERLDDLAAKGATSRSHVMRQITSFVLDSIKDDPEIGDYNEQVDRHYRHAHELINRMGSVSASLLQRHLRIDYHIALLLLDKLEKNHVITSQDENGRRMTMLQYWMDKAKHRAED